MNVRSKLSAGAVTLEHLPEMPGYNGSVSMIDSTEASEIAKDIDSAVVMIDELLEFVSLVYNGCAAGAIKAQMLINLSDDAETLEPYSLQGQAEKLLQKAYGSQP